MERSDILAYMKNLPDTVFSGDYLEKCTILLSGSAGWGIKEGSDEFADWDLHILLQDKDYQRFIRKFSATHVIDEVFGQIKPVSWLERRFTSDNIKWWPLYLWIYTRGKLIIDKCQIGNRIDQAVDRFNNQLPMLLREHFVSMCVLKCDAKSTTLRGNEIGAQLYCANFIQRALEVFSLAAKEPYAYRKWLAKQVSMLEGGIEFIALCEDALSYLASPSHRIPKMRTVEKALVQKISETVCDVPWMHEWWKFNDN